LELQYETEMEIIARDVQVSGGGWSQGARRNVEMKVFIQIWWNTGMY